MEQLLKVSCLVIALPAARGALALSHEGQVGLSLGDTASSTPEIKIDPSPEVSFLTFYFGGGETGLSSKYSYFGDGRLEIERFAGSSTAYFRSISQLNSGDLAEIVDTLVDTGLYALDPETFLARERAAGVRRLDAADAGFVILKISLLQRTEDSTHAWTILSREFAVSGGILIFDTEPQVRELQALRRLLELSYEARDRSEGE